ncbi:MAG: hypothetical protein HOF76_05390 [Candidatus Scalindua sp.]|jgi:polyhydroxyalkanoate synthesis regulator phasin|nr:hypothetical protein [Candidatus Scalindua sp.]MBT6046743.1 hypothetical protein [Candidatus Scalindua sp.]
MKRTDNATTNSEYLSNGIADIIVKIQKEEIPLETVKVLSSIAERISKVMILKIESENVHNTNSKTISPDLADWQQDLLDIFDKLKNNEIDLETAKALSSIAERISKITSLIIKSGNVCSTNSKTIKQDLADRQEDLLDIFDKLKNNEIDLETAKALSSIAGRINKITSLIIKSGNVCSTNSKTIKQDLVDRQKALLGIFDKLNNNKINMKTAKALSKKAMEQIRNVEKQIKGK